MAIPIYLEIHTKLKSRIVGGTYAYRELLPSESELTREFSCSRSSVRKALQLLATDGYAQPIRGKGVRVIFDPERDSSRSRGDGALETFAEMARRRGFDPATRTLFITNVVADEGLAETTGFPPESELTHIMRVRYADGTPVGTDESYYLASSVPGLTEKVVNDSIYRYLEDELDMSIVTSKRKLRVERANEADRAHVGMEARDAMGVMQCSAYDNDGILIEYTETRQRPGFFELDVTTVRSARSPRPVSR